MILEDLKKIVDMQHALNLQINEDYLNNHQKWDVAIITELAELLESTDYKWWKKCDIDYDNIKVECIDVLHFLISDFIQFAYSRNNKDYIKNIKTAINDINLGKFLKKDNFTDDIIDKVEPLIQMIFRKDLGFEYYIRFSTVIFLNLANSCNIDLDEILPRYITKNALNKLRSMFGYKEGRYKKLWIKDEKIVEDNVVAYELIYNSKIDNIDDALKLLQDYYLNKA